MTVYRTANLAFQIGHNAALIHEVADGADVLGLVECRDASNRPVDVAAILGPEWRVQQNLRSGAKAGSVTAVRKGAGVKVRRSRLRRISDPGRDVQARYQRETVLVDHGVVTEFAVGHLPVVASGRQDDAARTTRAWLSGARRRVARADRRNDRRHRRGKRPRLRRWLWAGDANQDPGAWARSLGAPHHFGVRPMALCWGPGWLVESKRARKGLTGTDHAVLTIVTKEKP